MRLDNLRFVESDSGWFMFKWFLACFPAIVVFGLGLILTNPLISLPLLWIGNILMLLPLEGPTYAMRLERWLLGIDFACREPAPRPVVDWNQYIELWGWF
jgi:hypothetical protein